MKKIKELNKEESKKVFKLPIEPGFDNIIIGKFRAFHAGHARMISRSADVNHFVLIGKSNLELRFDILRSALEYLRVENYEIWQADTGYTPSIVSTISSGKNISLTAGKDRLNDYIRQFEQADIDLKNINFFQTDRIYSSTRLIEKIKLNKWDCYMAIDHPWISQYVEKIKNEL